MLMHRREIKVATAAFINELGNLTVDAPTYDIARVALQLQAVIAQYELIANGLLENKTLIASSPHEH